MNLKNLQNIHTITFKYPDDTINTITSSGTALTPPSTGVEYHLFIRDDVPVCCEVISLNGNEHAEIGLTITNGALVDYDGVFECPDRLIAILQEMGIQNRLED